MASFVPENIDPRCWNWVLSPTKALPETTVEPAKEERTAEDIKEEILGRIRPKTIKCPKKGYNRTFANNSLLRAHLKRQHRWDHIRCPDHQCPKDKLYKSYDNLAYHIRKHHTEDASFKATCPFPNCTPVPFTKKVSFQVPLTVTYKVKEEEQGKHMAANEN